MLGQDCDHTPVAPCHTVRQLGQMAVSHSWVIDYAVRCPYPLHSTIYSTIYCCTHILVCMPRLPAIAGAVAAAPTGPDPYLQQGVP